MFKICRQLLRDNTCHVLGGKVSCNDVVYCKRQDWNLDNLITEKEREQYHGHETLLEKKRRY